MTDQTHEAFPKLTEFFLNCVMDNGGINRFRPVEDFREKLDECLGSDGVYYADLKALDAWLAALSKDDFETAVGGEEMDVLAVLADAPRMGESSAEEWIDAVYDEVI